MSIDTLFKPYVIDFVPNIILDSERTKSSIEGLEKELAKVAPNALRESEKEFRDAMKKLMKVGAIDGLKALRKLWADLKCQV